MIAELEEELYQEMTQKEKLLDMKARLEKEIESLRSYFAPPPGLFFHKFLLTFFSNFIHLFFRFVLILFDYLVEEEKTKVRDEAKIIEEFFQKWRENLNKELKQMASIASKISRIHHMKLTVHPYSILYLFLVFPNSNFVVVSY
jgi:hypothetical protein